MPSKTADIAQIRALQSKPWNSLTYDEHKILGDFEDAALEGHDGPLAGHPKIIKLINKRMRLLELLGQVRTESDSSISDAEFEQAAQLFLSQLGVQNIQDVEL